MWQKYVVLLPQHVSGTNMPIIRSTVSNFRFRWPYLKWKLLIVLLMMGILVLETCWGNKTTYFVASGWFFTFTMSTMHGHMNIKNEIIFITSCRNWDFCCRKLCFISTVPDPFYLLWILNCHIRKYEKLCPVFSLRFYFVLDLSRITWYSLFTKATLFALIKF
jgi:hypothetical protein